MADSFAITRTYTGYNLEHEQPYQCSSYPISILTHFKESYTNFKEQAGERIKHSLYVPARRMGSRGTEVGWNPG